MNKVFDLDLELAQLGYPLTPKTATTTPTTTLGRQVLSETTFLTERPPSASLPGEPVVAAALPPADVAPLEEKKRREGGKLVKAQRHTSGERAQWRQAARKTKAARKHYAHSSAGHKASKRAKRLNHKLHRETTETPVDGVETLITEVDALLANTRAEETDQVIKGFAEVALHADLLSRAFKVFGTAYQSNDLIGLSEDYDALADRANNVVLNLQESTDPIDGVALEAQYRAMSDVVMDATELYEVMGQELAEEAEASNSLGK